MMTLWLADRMSGSVAMIILGLALVGAALGYRGGGRR